MVVLTGLIACSSLVFFGIAVGLEAHRGTNSTVATVNTNDSDSNCTFAEFGYPFPECTQQLIDAGFRRFTEQCSFG